MLCFGYLVFSSIPASTFVESIIWRQWTTFKEFGLKSIFRSFIGLKFLDIRLFPTLLSVRSCKNIWLDHRFSYVRDNRWRGYAWSQRIPSVLWEFLIPLTCKYSWKITKQSLSNIKNKNTDKNKIKMIIIFRKNCLLQYDCSIQFSNSKRYFHPTFFYLWFSIFRFYVK